MKRLFFVTGRPSIGKTTVLLNAIEGLRARGYSVGGMTSREVRQEGARIGFQITDLKTGEGGWLAHINQPTGPQVSKYRVNLNDLEAIGVKAIQSALREADLVVIDEVGPMELFSQAFKQVVKDALDSRKLVLGVIHHSARDSTIEAISKRDDMQILEVTLGNRNLLHNTLIQIALQYLQREQQ